MVRLLWRFAVGDWSHAGSGIMTNYARSSTAKNSSIVSHCCTVNMDVWVTRLTCSSSKSQVVSGRLTQRASRFSVISHMGGTVSDVREAV